MTNRLSVIGIEAPGGLRTIELLQGDITQVPCDLLVVSASKGSYHPTPGSVFGALWENHGLNFWDELKPGRLPDHEFDLRDQFGIWASHTLEGSPCRRILCVELSHRRREGGALIRQLEESLGNVFVGIAILEAKGFEVRQVAMPLLGTGFQALNPAQIAKSLLARTRDAIGRSSSLERVIFVVRDPEKALLLQSAIDATFEVVSPNLPKADIIAALLAEIRSISIQLVSKTTGLQQRMAEEMLQLAKCPAPDTASIGLLARRLAECVSDVLFEGAPDIDLYKKIESLYGKGISPWMVNYLHTLRVIGNEVVHIREKRQRLPPALRDEDVAMCLFCIERVAQFWQESLQH